MEKAGLLAHVGDSLRILIRIRRVQIDMGYHRVHGCRLPCGARGTRTTEAGVLQDLVGAKWLLHDAGVATDLGHVTESQPGREIGQAARCALLSAEGPAVIGKEAKLAAYRLVQLDDGLLQAVCPQGADP